MLNQEVDPSDLRLTNPLYIRFAAFFSKSARDMVLAATQVKLHTGGYAVVNMCFTFWLRMMWRYWGGENPTIKPDMWVYHFKEYLDFTVNAEDSGIQYWLDIHSEHEHVLLETINNMNNAILAARHPEATPWSNTEACNGAA